MASPPLPLYPASPHQLPMSGIECPTDHDVKSGRGVSTNSHPGNERFRSLVNCNKELYVTSTKRQKMAISRSIVEAVRSLDPPGRFLEKNAETGLWSDIGDKKAIEKTSQALRDGAAALRKQLSADMQDPDFLAAVFDASAPLPEPGPKKPSKKKGKAPAKGHRRVKSNPTVGNATRTKALLKKARSGEVAPMSPKSSLNLPVIPRPPQSPMSPGGSDSSSQGLERKNLRSQDPFRRASEQVNYPESPPDYGQIERSASFDYHDLDRGRRDSPHHPGAPCSPPMAYGHYSSPSSPSGGAYHLPPPHPVRSLRGPHMERSPPSRGPMSPLAPGSHRMTPSGYHRGPSSPRVSWSPRQFNQSGTSLSPHPYLHPSDVSYRSPEWRPTLSPRMHYSHDPGRGSPSLAVPSLGGEQGPCTHSSPSPLWREPSGYYSPRSSQQYHRPSAQTEFLPPPPPPPHHRRSERTSPEYRYASPHRITSPARYPDPAESHGHHEQHEEEPYDEYHHHPATSFEYVRENSKPEYQQSEPILQRDVTSQPSPSPPIKSEDNLDSPSAVADIPREDMTTPTDERMSMPVIEQKRSRDGNEDYPFDEDNPAAQDDLLMSPLPYEGDDYEDPTTLLELPENLLQLPISPVGPQDDSD